MKDFHDLYSMIKKISRDEFVNLELVIRMVCAHRQTPLQLPLLFNQEEIKQLQKFWKQYRQSDQAEKIALPEAIQVVIEEINQWLSRY